MASNIRPVNSAPAFAAIVQLVGRSSATTRMRLAASLALNASQSAAVRRLSRSTCSIRRMSPSQASEGEAVRKFNIAKLSRETGLHRSCIYRAFSSREQLPNFATVLGALTAMGMQLKVTLRQRRA
jgi:hypothetical protein